MQGFAIFGKGRAFHEFLRVVRFRFASVIERINAGLDLAPEFPAIALVAEYFAVAHVIEFASEPFNRCKD